jgi:hypothetical protein
MGNWKIVDSGSTFDLDTDLGFKVEQQLGTGMGPVDNISQAFGLLDGAIHQRTRTLPRQFTLLGTVKGSNVSNLHTRRSALINRVKPDREASPVPVIFQYSGAACTVQASAYYDAGLELGNVTARIEQKIALRFTQYDPYWESPTSSSATLTTQTTIASANHILQRAACGVWGALGTGMNGTVHDIVSSSTGTYYVSGSFTAAGGTTACRVAQWNGTTWASVGNAMNNLTRALAIGGDGTLYAGGDFTTASNITACRVARWTGTAWAAMASGMNNTVRDLLVWNDGQVYAIGSFTVAGGVSACCFARWTGTAWAAPTAGGFNFTMFAMTKGLDGNIYAGGTCTTAGGTTSKYVARYNPLTNTFSSPGTTGNAINNDANCLAAGLDGSIYAGGDFEPPDGTTSGSHTARFNGTSWVGMAAGLSNVVQAMAVDQVTGRLYAGGKFTKSGSVTIGEGLAQWNGSVWIPMDVDLPGSASVFAIHSASNGILTVGFDQTGTASAAAVTTVTNSGTANTYPVLTACAPTSSSARLYQLLNATTNQNIYFNITLAPGEIVTLDLRPNRKTFSSNFRGNIISYILPSSEVSTWKLTPGVNNISFWLTGGSGAAKLSWSSRFWGVDN